MAKKKRAIVVGCGGALGGAWAAAALLNAENKLAWDFRSADVLIGTSAGAVLVSLLSAGVSVDEIAHWQSCIKSNKTGQSALDENAATVPVFPPTPTFEFTAAGLIKPMLKRQISLITGLSGLLPKGSSDMKGFTELIDAVVPGQQWTRHPATWLMAVDTASGQRVALGYPGGPDMPMSKAVRASYAVPGWCPPVEHAGRTYIDGGVASPTSADLLISTDVSEALVIAPMASTDIGTPKSLAQCAERLLRLNMTRIVEREVKQLEAAGIRVRKLYPNRDDLAVMGHNLMDKTKKAEVFEMARKTTGKTTSGWR
jgi:NTE family protein